MTKAEQLIEKKLQEIEGVKSDSLGRELLTHKDWPVYVEIKRKFYSVINVMKDKVDGQDAWAIQVGS